MNREQMARRCPQAELVGAGMLHKYRLCFSGHSALWGGPVANAVRDPEAQLAGALWRLSNRDLAALDGFEGHPWVYRRCTRLVLDAQGRRRRAQVYLKVRVECVKSPTRAYLRTIEQGYLALGFEVESLLCAAKRHHFSDFCETKQWAR